MASLLFTYFGLAFAETHPLLIATLLYTSA